jgi:hypothetical protein
MAISRFKTSTLAQKLPKHKKIRGGYEWNVDPNASFLRIAAPFNSTLGFNDYSASIKESGMNRVGTPVNNVAITATTSKFYGTSLNMGAMTDDGKVLFGNGSDLTLGTSDFTIEGWWYPTSITVGYQAFASHSGDTGDQQSGWILIMESNSTGPYFLATNNSGWPVSFSSSVLPTSNAWNHIAVTREGTTFRIFMNGTLTGTLTSNSTNITLPSSRELRIGNYNWFPGEEKGFQGFVQDFRMYIGVAKYTATFTVPDRIWLGA